MFQFQNSIGLLTATKLDNRSIGARSVLAEKHRLGISWVHQIIIDDEIGDKFSNVFFIESQINWEISHLDSSHLSSVVQSVRIGPPQSIGPNYPLESVPIFTGLLRFSLDCVTADHFLGGSGTGSSNSFAF
jgi:hypothetical protein